MNVMHFPPPPKDPLAFDGMGIKIGIGYYHAGGPQAAVLPDNVLFESGANWREHPHALIFRRKFLQLVAKSRHVIRQKFPLLILKGNFRNSETDRFQPLSASIGRFFEISSENGPGQGGEKTVRLGRNNLDL